MPPGTPDDMQPPSQPVPSQPLPSQHLPSHLGGAPGQRSPLGWASDPLGEVRSGMAVRRNMNHAAMIAGVGTGLACILLPVMLPVVPWVILGMLAEGGIAVIIYHRRTPTASVSPSQGFRLGLLSGFFGWLTLTAFFCLALLSQAFRDAIHSQFSDQLAATIKRSPDPAAAQKMAETLSTPSGLVSMVILGLILFGAFFLVFGGISGAIGASVFGKKPHQD